MSWWVYLNGKDGEPVEVENHAEGGTYAIGGVPKAELNVTYNYSHHIKHATGWEDSLWDLDGKTAEEVVGTLRDAVDQLGTEQADDYWNDTPGNAGHALSILLEWAEEYPEATFEVS